MRHLLLVACCGLAAAAACSGPRNFSAGEADSALTGEAGQYFIVTELDARLCPSPACGGYFVSMVNRKSTPCADGTLAAECHASVLDLSDSGLSEAEAARFERESFAQRHGLVRGELVQREVAPGVKADVLVAAEAWEGQARSTPTGHFDRLTSTGVVCITTPCPSFQGERLNGPLVRKYNAVDLAASGAPSEAVARGREALASSAILAAGVDVPITGPAGAGFDFRTVEFYLRLSSSISPCLAQDAVGVGACEMFLGYAWNGTACVGLSGCSCEGADCGALYSSEELCLSAHATCPVPCASSAECKAGEVCTTEDGVCNPPPGCGPDDVCPALCYGTCRPGSGGESCGSAVCAAGTVCCNASCGICTPPGGFCTQQACEPPVQPPAPGACKTDADCRTFSDYCTGCDCRALSVCQADPVCPGPGVRCLLDPCQGEEAACVDGACALRSAAGTCPTEECGPALGMPNYLCPDGKTIAGPGGRCQRHPDGSCGWEIVSCPDPGVCGG